MSAPTHIAHIGAGSVKFASAYSTLQAMYATNLTIYFLYSTFPLFIFIKFYHFAHFCSFCRKSIIYVGVVRILIKFAVWIFL